MASLWPDDSPIFMPHWAEPMSLTVIVCFVSLCVILQQDFLCNCWKLSIYKWETRTKCLKVQMTSFSIKGLVLQLRHGLLTLKAVVRVRPLLGFHAESIKDKPARGRLHAFQLGNYTCTAKKWQVSLKSQKQLSMWARLHRLLHASILPN